MLPAMTRAARKAASVAAAPADRSSRGRALVAALALFDIQGVAATTLEQVRDAADISVGSLYHHFGSREGLIAALYEDLLARYRAELGAALHACTDARALLDGFVAGHIGWAVAHPAAARFLARQRRDPALQAAEARLRTGTADFLRPLLARLKPAIAAGTIRALPPELLLSLVVGPVQAWLQQWFDGQTSQKPDAAARKLADLIWTALAVPSSHPRDPRT